jgi:hypothetical protein
MRFAFVQGARMRLVPHLTLLCAAIAMLTAPVAHAEIARDIDRRTAELKALERASADDPAVGQAIAELRAAIESGERAGAQLWDEINQHKAAVEALQAEKRELQEANQKLERVQTVLGSGLIGALVTAFVAIFGAVTTSRRSRADSDLKRLDVIVKARDLQKGGVQLPADIVRAYGLVDIRHEPRASLP